MKIRILFFGIVRDITGADSAEYEVENGIRINRLQEVLKEKFPGLSSLKNYAFAVNEAYAKPDQQLKENDTVAIIPPVSGG